MARFGRNEQLVIAGGAAIVAAYAVGVISQDWSINLSAIAIMAGALLAMVLSFTGSPAAVVGLQRSSLVRVLAAIVGAFALVDLGDLLSSLDAWKTLTIVLSIVYLVGAALLAYGAWAASGGNLLADGRAILGVARLPYADRLVFSGALGVIVGWFLLMWIADVFEFHVLAQVTVLAAVLILAIRWLDRNPTMGRLPIGATLAVPSLAAVAVVAGAWWLARVIGDTIELGVLVVYPPLLLFVLALGALGFGAFVSIGQAREAQTAA
jgi:hypothetical protein